MAGTTLVMAVWIASASTFEAALPVSGAYQIRTFANSDEGIDSFAAWVSSPSHDKVDLVCVAISGAEGSSAAKFWREDARVAPLVFVNPLQVELYATKHGIDKITAQTLANHCAATFARKK
jgi:hypothetical protein